MGPTMLTNDLMCSYYQIVNWSLLGHSAYKGYTCSISIQRSSIDIAGVEGVEWKFQLLGLFYRDK